MSLEELSPRLLSALQTRGLPFDRFELEGGDLSFLYPRGWHATWKEDHASLTHGDPPQGWLTVYPVPLRRTLSPEALLDAFLDEFVEPAVEKLSTVQIGRLERLPDIQAAQITLRIEGRDFQGLALAWVGVGQGRIISYWIEDARFRRGLIEDLLIALAGTITAPEGSPYAERSLHLDRLEEGAIWRDYRLELKTPFAAQAGRFAVKLPEGWEGLEVSYEGEVGWLLVPPGVDPRSEDAPLISISGADLVAPLRETLEAAIGALTEGDVYRPEQPPEEIDIRDQAAMVQLRVGLPPARPGQAFRLWSLGVTDGQSIVHLFAVAEASRLAALLPELNAIGRSIRVLPRVPNLALQRELTGYWRFLDSPETDKEVDELALHLKEDGAFRFHRRTLPPREAFQNPPDVAALTRDSEEGRWEVVDQTLTLDYPDGSREIFQIESVSERSAIIGKTFWERR